MKPVLSWNNIINISRFNNYPIRKKLLHYGGKIKADKEIIMKKYYPTKSKIKEEKQNKTNESCSWCVLHSVNMFLLLKKISMGTFMKLFKIILIYHEVLMRFWHAPFYGTLVRNSNTLIRISLFYISCSCVVFDKFV